LSDKRRRGRPFSEKLDHEFIESAVALLVEKGSLDAVSIDAVCAKTGASKASFYRRWPDRNRFIMAIMDSLRPAPLPASSGSLRDDLVAILDGWFGFDPERTRTVSAALVAEGRRNRELMAMFFRERVAPRRKALLERLRKAMADGEIDRNTDITMLYEIITAPVLKLMLLTGLEQTIPHRLAERLVDQALRGALPAAGASDIPVAGPREDRLK
jgi:AcrR family transcriptional regulator